MTPVYRKGCPPLDACLEVYRDCTLGGRRPVDDRARMQAMFDHANLVVGAWDGPRLLGVARALTDTAYCTYLSDLAVRDACQRQGIGRGLIAEVRAAAPQATLILLSAPQAVDYYPRLGFTRHASAWIIRADEPLR